MKNSLRDKTLYLKFSDLKYPLRPLMTETFKRKLRYYETSQFIKSLSTHLRKEIDDYLFNAKSKIY